MDNGFIITPKSALFDSKLCKPNIREFYSLIYSLSRQEGYCFASNTYFAHALNMDACTISKWVSRLKRLNYITVEYITADGTNNITQRKLYPQVLSETPIPIAATDKGILFETPIPYCCKSQGGIDANAKYNKINLKDKLKDKGNKKASPSVEPPFTGKMLDKVNEWLQYKQERRQSYKPTGLAALYKQLQNEAEKHGENFVISVIDKSIVNNWQGLFFDGSKATETQTDDYFLRVAKGEISI